MTALASTFNTAAVTQNYLQGRLGTYSGSVSESRKKQHNVILLQKATISLKNAVIGCSTTMKIRIFHTAHYETRITENESYQTLVAIFDHRR